MTTFRLNAGRPAAYHGSGSPARSHPANWWDCPLDPCPVCDAMVDDTDHRYWAPNMEDPVPLRCGCNVPWPVISLLGSHGQQVECDLHGFQRVTNVEIANAKRGMRKCRSTSNPNQSILPDIPPF